MTMPTIFDVTVSPEDGEEPFVPTAEDMVEWVVCDFCGEEYPAEVGECDCEMGGNYVDSERDFPMADEYEGVFGLSGYDPFYDNEPSYDW